MKLYKHPKFGHVYGERIKTGMGRILWPHLVTAKENTFPVKEGEKQPEPKFETTFLFPKEHKETASFLKDLKEMADEMIELYNKGQKVKVSIDTDDLVKDGDAMDEIKYPFCADNFTLVARHKDAPEIYDADVNDVEPKEVLMGMKGLLVVKPLCTAKGISFQLLTVQLGKDDGIRWGGGGKDSKDLLSAISEDVDDEDTPEDEGKQTKLPIAEKAKEVGKKSRGGLALNKLA